jgi:hypothetical protein
MFAYRMGFGHDAAMRYTTLLIIGAVLCSTLCGSRALAQGQDSTPGERNLRVMAELLPGLYDNVNQNYFDGRRKLPQADRHPRMSTTITRIEAPAFGRYVFLWVNRSETDKGPSM